jgi:hypothetical protein
MNVRGPGMEEAFAEFNDRILQEIATAVRLPVDLLTKPIPTDGGICPHAGAACRGQLPGIERMVGLAAFAHMQALRAEGSYLESSEWWDWRRKIGDAYYRALEYHVRCLVCGGSVQVLFAAGRNVSDDACCICREDACVRRRVEADPGNDWAAAQEIEIPEWVAAVHDGGWEGQ